MDRRQCIGLLSLVFLSQSFNFAFSMQPALLTDGRVLTAMQASLVLALGSLVSGLWQPVIGSWLDRGLSLRAFWVVVFAYTLGVGIFLQQQTEPVLLVAGCILLVISSLTLRTIISMALIARAQGAERAHLASLRYLVSNAALAISATVAMLAFEDWRAELLIADWVTTIILGGGVSLHLKRVSLPVKRQTFSSSLPILKEAWAQNGRRILGLNLVMIAFSGHLTYLPLLFAKRGQSSIEIGSATLLMNTILIILLLKPLSLLVRRWNDRRIGLIAVCFMAFGMVISPWMDLGPPLLIGIAVWTIGEIIFIPWEQVQLFNCFPNDRAGLASGAVTFLGSICHIVAPLFSSLLLLCSDLMASFALFAVPFLGYSLYRWSLRQDAAKPEENPDLLELAS